MSARSPDTRLSRRGAASWSGRTRSGAKSEAMSSGPDVAAMTYPLRLGRSAGPSCVTSLRRGYEETSADGCHALRRADGDSHVPAGEGAGAERCQAQPLVGQRAAEGREVEHRVPGMDG